MLVFLLSHCVKYFLPMRKNYKKERKNERKKEKKRKKERKKVATTTPPQKKQQQKTKKTTTTATTKQNKTKQTTPKTTPNKQTELIIAITLTQIQTEAIKTPFRFKSYINIRHDLCFPGSGNLRSQNVIRV